jgi:hypothetical protein
MLSKTLSMLSKHPVRSHEGNSRGDERVHVLVVFGRASRHRGEPVLQLEGVVPAATTRPRLQLAMLTGLTARTCPAS